jgi:glyoxylase-like metal-dependent hydrolase (beta-lactamase superfamily II)
LIRSRQLGRARLTGISEFYAPMHNPQVLYPASTPAVLEANRSWLVPDHWRPDIGRIITGVQMWALHVDDKVILIDAGYGNGKTRTTARANNLNTQTELWLAAAGVTPDTVTHVVTTHLHSDHIGWNTVQKDGAWVPFFPKAKHFIPRKDYEFFAELTRSGKAKDGGSFLDSIKPVVDAGLTQFVDPGDVIAGCLVATDAPGHTVGHTIYWLQGVGEAAVFCSDIFHHPLQIANPSWNTAFCAIPEQAAQTRADFLDRAARESALIMPCHFAPPHCGYARRDGAGYRYEAATEGWL